MTKNRGGRVANVSESSAGVVSKVSHFRHKCVTQMEKIIILFTEHIFSIPGPKHYFPVDLLANVPIMLNSYGAFKIRQIIAPGRSLTTFHRCFFQVPFFSKFGHIQFFDRSRFIFLFFFRPCRHDMCEQRSEPCYRHSLP